MSPRTRRGAVLTAMAALLVLAAEAGMAQAQSLADIARREQQRRDEVPSGRVYTDADLPETARPGATLQAAAPAPPAAPDARVPAADEAGAEPDAASVETAAEPGGPGTVIEGREKRDEPYWRNRAQDIRARLTRAIAEADAARSRLEAMEAGGASATARREQEVLRAALQRLDANAGFLRLELEQFEARARVEKVPPDWTR